ncbi:MAG: hypothetical protein MRY59_11365 [Aquisalinus sp.]|nr:hypothetical protein [Aquisalinus sp.]
MLSLDSVSRTLAETVAHLLALPNGESSGARQSATISDNVSALSAGRSLLPVSE